MTTTEFWIGFLCGLCFMAGAACHAIFTGWALRRATKRRRAKIRAELAADSIFGSDGRKLRMRE